MSKIFEVDFRQGSLKDRVSGTIPTNTNVIIRQQEKGRCAHFAGNAYLAYGIPPQNFFQSQFSIMLEWKPYDLADTRWVFGHTDSGHVSKIWVVTRPNGKFRIAIQSASKNSYGETTATFWNAQIFRQIFVQVNEDGAIQFSTGSGNIATTVVTNPGFSLAAYLGDYAPYIGAYNSDGIPNGTSYVQGQLARLIAKSGTFSSTEKQQYYSEFLASQHITKPIVIKRGDATEMIVSVDGTNWNADGGTSNASFGNLEIGSGAFTCLEDATGKYIKCTSNGTLTLSGIDLSIFSGNGYLKSVLGDLSGDASDTVDNASAFAFASNTLTITMTTNQVLRGFTITASA
jgi:hypothetical protein